MAVETLRGVGIGQIEALASAAEALKAAPGLKPDLILSAWIMPDIDGMALVRLIRRGETAFVRHVPVILMTAQATEETVEKARLAGVDEFVGKPFSIGAITTRIEAVLTRKRRFVDGANYAGPCRRRRDEDEYEGPLRRLMDDDPVSAIATDDEARAPEFHQEELDGSAQRARALAFKLFVAIHPPQNRRHRRHVRILANAPH
jgi:DNA-binding response OmpR family regulator